MKRKGIPITAAALLFAGALTFSGCGKDPFTVYDEAAQKTFALESIHAKADMGMSLSVLDQSLDISVDSIMKVNGNRTGDLTADVAMSLNTLGQSADIERYYTDGTYYIQYGDSKIKYPMEKKIIQEYIMANTLQTNLSEEDFNEISMEKKDGQRVLKFTINGASVSLLVDDALSSLASVFSTDNLDVNIADVEGTATVNKEGYFTQIQFMIPLSMTIMNQSVTTDMTMSVSYTDPGSDVVVEAPSDLDSYQEILTDTDTIDPGLLGASAAQTN